MREVRRFRSKSGLAKMTVVSGRMDDLVPKKGKKAPEINKRLTKIRKTPVLGLNGKRLKPNMLKDGDKPDRSVV